MTGRLDVVSLPNGRFLLLFSSMPHLGYDGPGMSDWQTAREELLAESGAVGVLRFDHPVTAFGHTGPATEETDS